MSLAFLQTHGKIHRFHALHFPTKLKRIMNFNLFFSIQTTTDAISYRNRLKWNSHNARIALQEKKGKPYRCINHNYIHENTVVFVFILKMVRKFLILIYKLNKMKSAALKIQIKLVAIFKPTNKAQMLRFIFIFKKSRTFSIDD